jgi:hypothetical protein
LASKSQINRELIADRIQMTRKALYGAAQRHPQSPFAVRYLSAGGAEAARSPGREGRISFSAIMNRRIYGGARQEPSP